MLDRADERGILTVRSLALACLLLLTAVPASAAPQPIDGTWLTEDGRSRIALEPCGARVCGKIIWLKEPNDPAGRPLTDKQNPDPARRGRPILGLPLFPGLAPDGDHWAGEVYNADDGKSYDVTLERTGPGTLKIEGCLLAILCKGETWTKAE